MSSKDSNLSILQKRVQVCRFDKVGSKMKPYSKKVGTIAGTMTLHNIDMVLVVFVGLPSGWFYVDELTYTNGKKVELYRPRDIPKLEGRDVMVKPGTLLYHPDNYVWRIIEIKPFRADYPVIARDNTGCVMALALDEILYLNRKPVVIPDAYNKRA